jgi:hypothetical protein
MFSQLGPLFKTTFRQAESSDARQKIPHEERDNPSKKQNEDHKKDTSSNLWEDNTSVSIEALRAFLINFLTTMPEAQNATIKARHTKEEELSQRPPESKRPTSTKNARAVRAYQSMAAQSYAAAPPPTPKKSGTVEPTADLLESKELRDIYKLIDDLDILAQKGIVMLNIQKASSFVESLKNAVEKSL